MEEKREMWYLRNQTTGEVTMVPVMITPYGGFVVRHTIKLEPGHKYSISAMPPKPIRKVTRGERLVESFSEMLRAVEKPLFKSDLAILIWGMAIGFGIAVAGFYIVSHFIMPLLKLK